MVAVGGERRRRWWAGTERRPEGPRGGRPGCTGKRLIGIGKTKGQSLEGEESLARPSHLKTLLIAVIGAGAEPRSSLVLILVRRGSVYRGRNMVVVSRELCLDPSCAQSLHPSEPRSPYLAGPCHLLLVHPPGCWVRSRIWRFFLNWNTHEGVKYHYNGFPPACLCWRSLLLTVSSHFWLAIIYLGFSGTASISYVWSHSPYQPVKCPRKSLFISVSKLNFLSASHMKYPFGNPC